MDSENAIIIRLELMGFDVQDTGGSAESPYAVHCENQIRMMYALDVIFSHGIHDARVYYNTELDMYGVYFHLG
jgi:hypothetical protein